MVKTSKFVEQRTALQEKIITSTGRDQLDAARLEYCSICLLRAGVCGCDKSLIPLAMDGRHGCAYFTKGGGSPS